MKRRQARIVDLRVVQAQSSQGKIDQGSEVLHVTGELELLGATHPLAFDLAAGPDGKLSGVAVVKQTDWGMKPYSALFGTLKVVDEVHVAIDAQLPAPQSL